MHVNVEQRQINVICFNVDLNIPRCYSERQFLQRWATSKQRCEYNYLQKGEK